MNTDVFADLDIGLVNSFSIVTLLVFENHCRPVLG